MQPANLLFILSDERSKRVLDCYGNRFIRTPHGYRFLGNDNS